MDLPLLIADFVHLITITALLLQILSTRKCNELSAKTQFLLASVYSTRYLDAFTACMTAYNAVTKGLTILIVYSTFIAICGCYKKNYEHKHDTYRIGTLLVPCLVLAIFFNHEFTIIDILWAFSQYLEAVAMVPQFVLLTNTRRAHKSVLCYITALAIYNCLYIIHWIDHYYQHNTLDKISACSSIIQCLLYSDFFVNIWIDLELVKNDNRSSSRASISEKNRYLNMNMNVVGLDPSSLSSKNNEKDLFKTKEEI